MPESEKQQRNKSQGNMPHQDATVIMRESMAYTRKSRKSRKKKKPEEPVHRFVNTGTKNKKEQELTDPVLLALQAFCEESQTRKFIPPNSCQMSDEDARAFFSEQAGLNRSFTVVKHNAAGERFPDGLLYSNGDGKLYCGSEKDIREQLQSPEARLRFDKEMAEVNRRFPKVVQSIVEVMENPVTPALDESTSVARPSIRS